MNLSDVTTQLEAAINQQKQALAELERNGWRIGVGHDAVGLYRYFPSGEPRKTPTFYLAFNTKNTVLKWCVSDEQQNKSHSCSFALVSEALSVLIGMAKAFSINPLTARSVLLESGKQWHDYSRRGNSAGNNSVINKLALNSRYKISYEDADGDASERIIRLIKQFSNDEHDWLMAFCELRHEVRTFRVDRLIPPIVDVGTGEILWSRTSMAYVLQKGANANLSNIAPQVDDLLVTLEWAFPVNDVTQSDMDVSAFLLTAENKVRGDRDIVFYNKPANTGNTVVLLERTCPNRQSFKLNLSKIPKAIVKIAFTLTLYEPEKTQVQLSQLQSLHAVISNGADTIDYVSYPLEPCDNEAALIVLEVYRYQGDWKVRAINQGFVGGLAALAPHYGVVVKEKPAPKPPKVKPIVSYNTNQFVVFDLETTGLDAYRHEIIEIGAVKYCNGRYTELQCLVKPVQEIPAFITGLTGITQAMVDREGIAEFDALLRFVAFIEDYPLIAYNAPFDRRFIAAAGEKYSFTVANPYQCALQMARKAWTTLDNHRLETVIKALQLADGQQHRALSDCYLTASVYLKAADILTH